MRDGHRSSEGAPRFELGVATLAIHVLALALPLTMLQVYDRIIRGQSFGTAIGLVIGVAIAVVLEAITRHARAVVLANKAAREEATRAPAMVRRLLAADTRSMRRMGVSMIKDGFDALTWLREARSSEMTLAPYEAPALAIYLALVAHVGGWLVAIPLVILAVAASITVIGARSLARTTRARADRQRRERDYLRAVLSRHLLVKALGAENAFTRYHRGLAEGALDAGVAVEAAAEWTRQNAALFAQLSTILLVAFGAVSVIEGAMTTGALAACTMLAGRSLAPGIASLGHWSAKVSVDDAEDRVRGVETLPEAISNTLEFRSGPKGRVTVRWQGVLPEPLVVAAGERVALVGDPLLVERVVEAFLGVAEDGLAATVGMGDDVVPAVIEGAVRVLGPRPVLIPGSVLNNLTFHDPRLNDRVLTLAERLGARPMVEALPQGALTEVVVEGDPRLPLGLRQRIALARALATTPLVLVAHHAMDQMDIDGQKRVAALLADPELRDTTIIMATREPIHLAACDRVISMEAMGHG